MDEVMVLCHVVLFRAVVSALKRNADKPLDGVYKASVNPSHYGKFLIYVILLQKHLQLHNIPTGSYNHRHFAITGNFPEELS